MHRNWKQFTRRITIKASPKAAYEAWTTQQGLESWFLRNAYFFKADGTQRARTSATEGGDKYTWAWYGYDDTANENKNVVLANGWDHLQFVFSGDCIVTVTIKQEENETICELTQEMPMDDVTEQQYFYIECAKGWTFYLSNLKSILEGGLDLRNKNVRISDVINS